MSTSQSNDGPRLPVKPRAGLLHIVDAAGYSLAGFRRLTRETAARLELLGCMLAFGSFFWLGASAWHWLALVTLCAVVLSLEALNTAIEVLTDQISPEWSEFAKDAKDLGSLAVGLMLCVSALFVCAVLFRIV